eukprot:9933842-Heterocapsa_arctica.AAC.1
MKPSPSSLSTSRCQRTQARSTFSSGHDTRLPLCHPLVLPWCHIAACRGALCTGAGLAGTGAGDFGDLGLRQR